MLERIDYYIEEIDDCYVVSRTSFKDQEGDVKASFPTRREAVEALSSMVKRENDIVPMTNIHTNGNKSREA